MLLTSNNRQSTQRHGHTPTNRKTADQPYQSNIMLEHWKWDNPHNGEDEQINHDST